ncbi:MAG: hypothetical protein ACLUS8_11155 [Hominenteromicrobium sp.]
MTGIRKRKFSRTEIAGQTKATGIIEELNALYTLCKFPNIGREQLKIFHDFRSRNACTISPHQPRYGFCCVRQTDAIAIHRIRFALKQSEKRFHFFLFKRYLAQKTAPVVNKLLHRIRFRTVVDSSDFLRRNTILWQ